MAAHAEAVVAVVAETDADIGENKDNGSGVDNNGGGNVGVNSGSGDSGWQRRWRLKQG